MTYADNMEIIRLMRENRLLREQLKQADALIEAHHRVGFGLEWGEKCEACAKHEAPRRALVS